MTRTSPCQRTPTASLAIRVDGPLTAYAEADIIEEHALAESDGLTYAELDREDPRRETVMTASFLRSSLFTSVVSFGVALMAFGLGIVLVLIGIALLRLARQVRCDRGGGAGVGSAWLTMPHPTCRWPSPGSFAAG